MMMASPLSIASSRGRTNGFAHYGGGSPLSWTKDATFTKDYSMSRELSKGANFANFGDSSMFDHPTPTSFSHLAFLSTSASSFTSDSGERLPKLEQSFCKGYSCCGLALDDLHGLLEHFEEHHVLGTSPAGSLLSTQIASTLPHSASIKSPRSVGQALSPNAAGNPVAQFSSKISPLTEQNVAANSNAFPAGAPFSMDDMDMEMDMTYDTSRASESSYVTPAGLTGSSSKAFNFTAAIGRSRPVHPLAFSTRRSASPKSAISSPELSAPSTPTMDSDMESDFDPSASSSSLNLFPPMGTITPAMLFPQSRSSQSPPVVSPIDEPNADMLSLHESIAQLPSQPQVPTPSGSATIIMGNDPTSTTLAPLTLGPGQQGFVAPPPTMPSGRVWTPPASKPFKCPVPGCDKAYKQQNGLKYHRLHGHCNNRGRDPATAGGEEDGRETLEEKPFGCYVGQACGKRYKNMNGLRYHYQHSGPHGQIGLEMLAMGTHPAPLTPAGARSRPASAASSRNVSRANSPAPSPILQSAVQPAAPQITFANQPFPNLPIALSGH